MAEGIHRSSDHEVHDPAGVTLRRKPLVTTTFRAAAPVPLAHHPVNVEPITVQRRTSNSGGFMVTSHNCLDRQPA